MGKENVSKYEGVVMRV